MPATQPIDPLAALIEYLKADTALNTFVDSRVFGGKLPPAQSKDMSQPCVVIRNAGGPGLVNQSLVNRQRVIVRCYGQTIIEANRVQLLAQKALSQINNFVSSNDELLYCARQTSAGTSNEDATTTWNYNESTWMLSTHLNEVS